MWTRAQLKTSAKDVLRRNYWMPFLASFLYNLMLSFLGGSGSSMPSFSVNLPVDSGLTDTTIPPEAMEGLEELFGSVDWAKVLPILAVGGLAVVAVTILATVISLALRFFVVGPLAVGHARYYIVNRERDARLDELFAGFKKGYMNVAKAQFMTMLFIELWSLLFLVPGIIYGYKWNHVARILAENPNLTGKRAREISAAMTDGEKLEMFVLDLSFIGWMLLGALCCGFGIMFVEPYVQATMAELYAVQRQRVLEAGLATEEELPGV